MLIKKTTTFVFRFVSYIAINYTHIHIISDILITNELKFVNL